MSNIIRPALKLMYNLLAKPGLGNPHAPYENELMISGAKPVLIIDAKEVTTELEDAIYSGYILKINEHHFENKYKIYCHVSELPNAEKAAEILEQSWQNEYTLSEENARFLSAFFNTTSEDVETTMAQICSATSVIGEDILEGRDSVEVQKLLDGDVQTLAPVRYIQEYPSHKNFDKSLLGKGMSSAEIIMSQTMVVLARSDLESEGRELDARYFQGGEHDYPDVKNPGERIGQLLGYTENDIAWFNATKYQNPIINKMMIMTEDIRRNARKNSMLMER